MTCTMLRVATQGNTSTPTLTSFSLPGLELKRSLQSSASQVKAAQAHMPVLDHLASYMMHLALLGSAVNKQQLSCVMSGCLKSEICKW